jgi:plastocyanin
MPKMTPVTANSAARIHRVAPHKREPILMTPALQMRATRARLTVGWLAALALALAACSGASPSASTGSSVAAEPSASNAPATQVPTPTEAPLPTPRVAGAHCEVTPGAHVSETANWSFAVKPRYTIKAGQALAFTPALEYVVEMTVTEGTNGTAAADACVDQPLAAGSRLVVSFYQPGDYSFFCRITSIMHTVIHVQ